MPLQQQVLSWYGRKIDRHEEEQIAPRSHCLTRRLEKTRRRGAVPGPSQASSTCILLRAGWR